MTNAIAEAVMTEAVVKLIGAILLMIITLVGSWLCYVFGENKKLANISLAKDEVIAAAQLTVEELQQKLVEGLKAAHADGKLTKDEIASLGEQLVEGVLAKMSKPAAELLQAAGVDIINLIQSAGEAWILELKKG